MSSLPIIPNHRHIMDDLSQPYDPLANIPPKVSIAIDWARELPSIKPTNNEAQKMSTKVRMSELSQMIQVSVLSNQPLLIIGAPGIGKSAAAEHARTAFPNPDGSPMDMILSHPVVSDPTDAKGFPAQFVNEDGSTFADFLPYGDLRQAMEATKPTLWFLDDLGQAAPSVQASYMQLLLAREVNGKKISPNIRFIAATNRRKDKAGVSGLLEPVKSRFATIVELIAHVDDFTSWAQKSNILPSIIGYLKFNPSALHEFKPSLDMQPSPCPRTWHKLSDTLIAAAQVPMLPTTRDKLVSGVIGNSHAVGYLAFEKLYETDLPDIDNIMLHPETLPANLRPDVMFACCSAIAARCSTSTFSQIVALTERMPAEFGKMLISDCKDLCPEIIKTEAFVNYSVGQQTASGFRDDDDMPF